jgi:uncharacterized protein
VTIDPNASAAGACPRAVDPASLYDLGVSYSTGTCGKPLDLIEAHICFNLAARSGSEKAATARADVADVMSAGEITAAQRRARAWLVAPAQPTGGLTRRVMAAPERAC